MKPSTNHTYHIPSPANHGGFFITPTLTKKTRTELTIVNKPIITISISITYKHAILLTVKTSESIVNKIWLLSAKYKSQTTNYYPLTLIFFLTFNTYLTDVLSHLRRDAVF